MQDIDLQQIEIFIKVARLQNISRAAQELYISQSSISNRITKMESDCGMKLFNRTNRGVSLTPAGEILYARLDIAYNRFRVSVAEICRDPAAHTGTLRIGFLNRADTIRAAERDIAAFSAANPGVEIESEMFNHHELRYKVLCGELDLAYSVSYDVGGFPEYEYKPLEPLRAFFFIPDGWKAEMDAGAGFSVLNGRPLILETPTADAVSRRACRAYGFEPGETIYADTYILMAALAARGDGFVVDGDFSGRGKYYYPPTAMVPITKFNFADIAVFWRRSHLCPRAQSFLDGIPGPPANTQV